MVASYGERVIYLMRMVSVAHGHWLDAELRKHDLNRAQWGALSQLALEHPDTMSGAVLARRAGVTAPSMSAAVATLLERDLVVRTPNPAHGRILDVSITPAGSRLVDTVQQQMDRLERRALAPLTDEQGEALVDALRTMMTDLDLYVPPRG